jgi:hypothetical protein
MGHGVRLREPSAPGERHPTEKRTYAFRAAAGGMGRDPRREYGPSEAFDAVSGVDGRVALEHDIVELIGRFNRAADGTMVVPSEYLEAVIVKR